MKKSKVPIRQINISKQIKERIRASLVKEMEQQLLEQEKILQQKEQEFELKKKWNQANKANIICQPLTRADRDLFLQVKSITREEIFPKIKFITNQEQLDEFEKSGSLGYYFIQYCKHNCPTSMINMNDGEFWNHIKKLFM